MKDNLHLVVTYPEYFPKEIIENDISELQETGLEILVTEQGNEAYAAMEWIVPTFFATYILKPYFDSFLQEAGKDHYQLLKDACKNMLAKGKATQAILVPAKESTQKISGKYTQSIAVSILYRSKTDRQIKMLFDNNLDLEDWQNALDEFSEVMLEHYKNFPNDKFSDLIKNLSPKQYYTIYIKIDPTTKILEFHDDHTLMSETRNLNRD